MKKNTKDQKMKEVLKVIEELKATHPKDTRNPSLFFSDIHSNVEIILKENGGNSTVDAIFGVIMGSFHPEAPTKNFLQYQFLGSDHAISFEASLLTSEKPIHLSYHWQNNHLLAFISGIGELATTTATFQNVPFTFILQKTPQSGSYLLTIDSSSEEAPVVIGKNTFLSPERIITT